jgi:KUP system potassium uptake protein
MEAAYGFSISIAMMMTTILLSYFLFYKIKWNKIVVYALLLVFATIETSFFIANIAKIKQRWMFLFFELFIFTTMYVWYYARKINNRFTKFVELDNYMPLLKELSEDQSIPKFTSNLIYLTKANTKHEIEEKIIKSIFAKRPKRADIYWLVHINRIEHPFTLTYDVIELIEGKLIKININVGFRIQPKTEFYYKKIVNELINHKELNLYTRLEGSNKYNSEFDFKFVVIHKYLSVENEFALREGLLLNTYFFLNKLGQSDEKAFGLDKSDVLIENYPLVYQPITKIELVKNNHTTNGHNKVI